jgi:hypothetical protein
LGTIYSRCRRQPKADAELNNSLGIPWVSLKRFWFRADCIVNLINSASRSPRARSIFAGQDQSAHSILRMIYISPHGNNTLAGRPAAPRRAGLYRAEARGTLPVA